jgi:hypothetical protein
MHRMHWNSEKDLKNTKSADKCQKNVGEKVWEFGECGKLAT